MGKNAGRFVGPVVVLWAPLVGLSTRLEHSANMPPRVSIGDGNRSATSGSSERQLSTNQSLQEMAAKARSEQREQKKVNAEADASGWTGAVHKQTDHQLRYAFDQHSSLKGFRR